MYVFERYKLHVLVVDGLTTVVCFFRN